MFHPLLIAFYVRHGDVLHAGANNIMLLSSGLTYGFRPTIPHIMGITVGFAFMVGAVGLGLGTIFIAYPVLQTIRNMPGSPTWSIWPSISRCPSRPRRSRTTAAGR